MQEPHTNARGFTLIELSIVLVIIGLIVGGVLVGQDLIRAAYVRAQIAQIEKLNTAVNTFRGKFNALPGDLTNDIATQYGFAARGALPGQGDGNMILEGQASGTNAGVYEGTGETAMFWVDLTTANGLNINLIEGGFNAATPTGTIAAGPGITGTALPNWLPPAKMGRGDYIYAYSVNGINYYGLSRVNRMQFPSAMISYFGLTVKEAYDIDRKTDDGLPQSGSVLAMYLFGSDLWAAAGGWPAPASFTTATPPDSTTCFDNANVTGTNWVYSMSQNSGAGLNCGLSFKFQ